MALTKEDLRQISEVLEPRFDALEGKLTRKIDSAVGELAIAAQKQFLAIDTRLDGMYARFDAMDARFDTMDARFDGVDARLGDLADDTVVVKDMVKDHGFRIAKTLYVMSIGSLFGSEW